MDDYKGAWFGSAELKAEAVARMQWHRAQDLIAQGVYQELLLGLRTEQQATHRGCAIGCLLPLQPDRWKLDLGDSMEDVFGDGVSRLNWHLRVEEVFGIDRWVAFAIDNIFEEQDSFESAAKFAVAVMEAIPVGADLRALGASYYLWRKDDEEGQEGWDGGGVQRARFLIEELENSTIATGARAMILVG